MMTRARGSGSTTANAAAIPHHFDRRSEINDAKRGKAARIRGEESARTRPPVRSRRRGRASKGRRKRRRRASNQQSAIRIRNQNLAHGPEINTIGFVSGEPRLAFALVRVAPGKAAFLARGSRDPQLREKSCSSPRREDHIERAWNSIRGTIHPARRIVIGRKGAESKNDRRDFAMRKEADQIDIQESNAELDAQLVAENVALQIERRIASRRAMKKRCKSRWILVRRGFVAQLWSLNGAEISRSEWYREGRYRCYAAHADRLRLRRGQHVYGKIGVKCWICKKEEAPRRGQRVGRCAGTRGSLTNF